ncbi:four helix bundle protein [Candidatus Uhrbacteria bacterium]|jgi:four helix bundle protein|nr:four helix bundle protein [Candidatus Uhrbacteria bacterium]
MTKQEGLEERALAFSRKVREFVKLIPRHSIYQEDIKQLVRSSGSVGANYIEANESFSGKDFLYRINICRKEAKESRYWLKCIVAEVDNAQIQVELIQEALELSRIFGKVIQTMRNKKAKRRAPRQIDNR